MRLPLHLSQRPMSKMNEMFLYALILDSIEANVEQAQNYVEGANVQLSKASVYQVRQRLRIKKI